MKLDAAALSAAVLGFGLGGFFDGILLHQILQWHHLLSLVPEAGDLAWQLLWDGWFHAAMYGLAAGGLIGLWRAHGRAALGSGRRLGGLLLIGFGLWHGVDALLSHWLLGIHRIRLDSDLPLAWDLGWLVLFGLLPAWIGWRLAATAGRPPRRPAAGLAALTLIVAAAGALAARPPADQPFSTIVFAGGMEPAAVMAALTAADARLLWADAAMTVVVADMPAGRALGLYGAGARLVGGAGLPAGCLGWIVAPA